MAKSIINFAILEPKDFVLLCADVLEAEGFKDVKVTEGSGDWKIDITADEFLESQAGDYEILHFMVQCKHYAKSGRNIRLFKEILMNYRYAYPRLSAAKALGKIDNPEALQALTEGLSDSSTIVVRQISKIIARARST